MYISKIEKKLQNYIDSHDLDDFNFGDDVENIEISLAYTDNSGEMVANSVLLHIDDNYMGYDLSLTSEYIENNVKEELINNIDMSKMGDIYKFLGDVLGDIDINSLVDKVFYQATRYIRDRYPYIYNELCMLKIKKALFLYGEEITFFIYYNKKLRKYELVYNPIYFVRSVFKDYIINNECYYNLEKTLKYNMIFYICHEIMHVLRHHVQRDRTNKSEILNRFEDAYINMELQEKLSLNSNLTRKPVTPFGALTSDNYYEGYLKEEYIGGRVSKIHDKVRDVLNKNILYNIDNKIIDNGRCVGDDKECIIKISHPKSEILQLFDDNSNNFVDCMYGIIDGLTDRVREIKKDEFLHPGVPVRIKDSGERGVIVDIEDDDLYRIYECSSGNEMLVLAKYMMMGGEKSD